MTRAFSSVLVWLGVPAIGCVWLLALSSVWEQTVGTWDRDVHTGSSLLHSGAGALWMLATLVSLLWPVATLADCFLRRSLSDKRIWVMLAAYGFGWLLLCTPDGFWHRLFISKFTPSQATELLSRAAADGDLRTVRAFLDAGVPANAQGTNGTALHAAAMQGQVEVLEYLISRGADVNAVNAYGNSPLIDASGASERAAESQAVLARHGGLAIWGSKEQRAREAGRRIRERVGRMPIEMPR
jgi:hypothetical protein